MTQITLSPGQLEGLVPGPALVECRDGIGNLVGYLHIAVGSREVKVPQFTADELDQFEQEPGGRSLSDILSDLRKQR